MSSTPIIMDYNTRIDEILLTLLLEMANDREEDRPLNWQAKYSNKAKDKLSQLLLEFVEDLVGVPETIPPLDTETEMIDGQILWVDETAIVRNKFRAEIKAKAKERLEEK